MIEKRTMIDRIEIDRDGVISLRFAKELVENGVVLSKNYHRTVITPDTDIDNQLNAVDNHLQQMGVMPLDTEDRAWIKSMKSSVQTPDRTAKWRARQEQVDGQSTEKR